MEKFRPFTDRATGIDPFVCFIKPTLLSYTIACILFPFRLLLALALVLLLMLLDLLHFALQACGSYVHYVVSMLLFLPFARHFCLRGILFALTNCTVHEHKTFLPTHAQASMFKNKQCRNSYDNDNVPEVILVNMQSVWDVFVAELALNTEDYLVAFPLPQNLQSTLVKKKELTEQKHKGTEETSNDGTVKVFRPGCLNRWRVMMYIYYTGTLNYLQQWSTNSKKTAQSNTFTVNVRPLQEQLMQEHKNTPILLFAEGTTSNGRGILALPSLELIQPLYNKNIENTCTRQEELEQQGLYIRCISIYYNSPSLLTVITESNKTNQNSNTNNITKESESNVFCAVLNGCRCCFQFGSLLFGSKDVKWRSPFLPSAIYTIHRQQITNVRGNAIVAKNVKEEDNKNNNSIVVWKMGAEAMREVQAGFINVMTNRMLQRQRLSVGIAEKLEYVKLYMRLEVNEEQ